VEGGAPLVSYILVNWRTEDWLPRALDSIRAQKTRLREVLLVNNASPAWHPGLLDDYPEVKLLDLPRNRGFAGGNNAALRECHGDMVVLLNCDAYLDPDFTTRAIDVFRRNPRLGTVAPKILRDAPELDGLWRFDSTGHVMRLDRTTFSRAAGEADQGQYDAGGYVFGASAAAVAYRHEMLDEVAVRGEVFDESFFAYFEDVDLDWRAQLAGWDTYYEPRCVAYHRGHGSGGRRNLAVQLRAEKNRYLLRVKHDSLVVEPEALAPLLVYELRHLLLTLFKPWLWPAYLLLLASLPGALARSFAGSRRWKRRRRDVARWFVPRGPLPPPAATAPEDPPVNERPPAAVSLEHVPTSWTGGDGRRFPLASVVLVNYNGLELTCGALTALRQQTYPELEVIVVDNGSRANEAREIARRFPEVRPLRLEGNQGFTGGVNWGASLARGEWVVLLNNDALPAPGCIRNLVYAQRRTGAAAVSGRLVDLQDEDLITAAMQTLELEADEDAADAECADVLWGAPPGLEAALAESRQNHGLSWFGYIVRGAYGRRLECFYPSGGLCCLPRAVLAALGPELFPQRWFAYYEDVALGYRLRALGGSIAKEPRAAAVHLASSTASRLGSFRLAYLRERNRLQLIRTWLPAAAELRLAPLLLVQHGATFMARLITQPLGALGFAAAHLWCLGTPVALWRQRQAAAPLRGRGIPAWMADLSGRIRGSGGAANALALAWVRLTGLPCLEDRLPPPGRGDEAQQFEEEADVADRTERA
jgi:GT2 family glycosyltransferase